MEQKDTMLHTSNGQNVDGFEKIANALGPLWNEDASIQVTGSRGKSNLHHSQCLRKTSAGVTMVYWCTGVDRKNIKPPGAVVDELENMWAAALLARGVSAADTQSFTIFMWRPWLWPDAKLEWHVDQNWVGKIIHIKNFAGAPYMVSFVRTSEWFHDNPTVTSEMHSGQSEYTLEGAKRFGFAHEVVFSRTNTELVCKTRLGMEHPGPRKRVWVMPNKVLTHAYILCTSTIPVSSLFVYLTVFKQCCSTVREHEQYTHSPNSVPTLFVSPNSV
jgi:hypothetical protein